MRTSRYLFSEQFSPWMHAIAAWAAVIAKDRHGRSLDNPLARLEAGVAEDVSEALRTLRDKRDSGSEALFSVLYGGEVSPVVAQV
jgi:hypothetical protein